MTRLHRMRRLRRAASIASIAVLGAPCALHADDSLGLRVEATATADSNVTRSRGADKLSDVAFGISVAKTHVVPLSRNTRLTVLGTAGAERFDRYTGLSRVFLNVNGEYQYRPSGEFAAPTFGVFVHSTVEQYQSKLRDGYRHSLGARVVQPLSTKLDLFAAVAYNVRDGKSRVFDNKDYSIRLNLDYSVSAKGTLYGGGELRRGDIVSTARPALGYVDVAEAIVTDDAFNDTVRQAYRLRANTVIATLGYNLALQANHSLDLSLRLVRSSSLARPSFPGADVIRYYDAQAAIAYLVRF